MDRRLKHGHAALQTADEGMSEREIARALSVTRGVVRNLKRAQVFFNG